MLAQEGPATRESQTPPGSETLGPQDLREPSPASQAWWTADPRPAPVCCPGPDALSRSSRLSLAFQRVGCLAGGSPEEGRQHTHPSHPAPPPGLPGPLLSLSLPHVPSALSPLLCTKLQHSQRSPTAATNPVLGSRSASREPQLV